MRLRNRWLINAVAFFGALLIRLWMGTLRYRYQELGVSVDSWRTDLPERYIYAFWHEYILMPAYHRKRNRITVLISQHADGQLISDLVKWFGFEAVRGSTTRGGIEAIRQLLRNGQTHVAITPDGPRGPRRQLQQGLIYLASRTGMPIVPVGVGYERAWRAKNWDRFAIPRPWCWATCVSGQPIRIPQNLDREQLESFRRQVEATLHAITEKAEKWAESQGKISVRNDQETGLGADPRPGEIRQAG